MDNLNYFRNTLDTYKDGPKAVSWGNKLSQEVRFKVLCEIGTIHGKSILDVGCGLGDLYGYLEDPIINYTGYDIVSEMVDGARKKYPKAKFIYYYPTEKFDYVLASGIFNLEILNWQDTTYTTIKKMFESANIGVGINFTKRSSSAKNEITHYSDPIEIMKLVAPLTPKMTMRADYKPNDFTIFLYK